ncbi:hypothetical protein [Peptoanaerobacter stomatis]|uniref:hypothetical protein n=1 Tax=Peptoanaerobacter stomatis TaxID=796937 RepID=UPI003FA034E1
MEKKGANMEDKKHKTELRIYTECLFNLAGLKDVIQDIREIEKEHNCNCTLLDVKIIDTRTLKK